MYVATYVYANTRPRPFGRGSCSSDLYYGKNVTFGAQDAPSIRAARIGAVTATYTPKIRYSSLFWAVDCIEQKIAEDTSSEKEDMSLSEDSTQAICEFN